MTTVETAVPTLRFSTEDYSARERTGAWRDFFGRGILKIDIEPTSEEFRLAATLRVLPGVGFFAGNTVASHFNRPRHLVDSDDIALGIVVEGVARFNARGRTATLHPGAAVMTDGAEAVSSDILSPCRFLGLRVPRRAIAPAVPALGDRAGMLIPAGTPALRLLTSYLSVLSDAEALATPQMQQRVATYIQDLFALTLGATDDGLEIAKSRGLAAARLKAIKDDIARNLVHGDVSVGAIALRHKVTPRYVQMLFEGEDVTFTEYVTTRRLEHVYRMFDDPRHDTERVAAIAFDAGFTDLSHFNRLFRRHYGLSPSDVRARRDKT